MNDRKRDLRRMLTVLAVTAIMIVTTFTAVNLIVNHPGPAPTGNTISPPGSGFTPDEAQVKSNLLSVGNASSVITNTFSVIANSTIVVFVMENNTNVTQRVSDSDNNTYTEETSEADGCGVYLYVATNAYGNHKGKDNVTVSFSSQIRYGVEVVSAYGAYGLDSSAVNTAKNSTPSIFPHASESGEMELAGACEVGKKANTGWGSTVLLNSQETQDQAQGGITSAAVEYTTALAGTQDVNWSIGSTARWSVASIGLESPYVSAPSVEAINATTTSIQALFLSPSWPVVHFTPFIDGVKESNVTSNVYNYTGLSTGVGYDLKVGAWNSSGHETLSSISFNYTRPLAPTGMYIVNATSSDSTTVHWTPATGVNITGQSIYYTTETGNSSYSCGGKNLGAYELSSTASENVENGLIAETQYIEGFPNPVNMNGFCFFVVTQDPEWSSLPLGPSIFLAWWLPGGPTNVHTFADNSTGVSATWTNPAGPLDYIDVCLGQGEDVGACGELNASATSDSRYGLSPDTTYSFFIIPYNNTGGSLDCGDICYYDNGYPLFWSISTASYPSSPTSLQESLANNASISVSWSNPEIGEVVRGVDLYYETWTTSSSNCGVNSDGTEAVILNTTGGLPTSYYLDQGISRTSNYCFWANYYWDVGSTNVSGQSSSILQVDLPSPPTGLEVTGSGGTYVDLSWTNIAHPYDHTLEVELYYSAYTGSGSGVCGVTSGASEVSVWNTQSGNITSSFNRFDQYCFWAYTYLPPQYGNVSSNIVYLSPPSAPTYLEQDGSYSTKIDVNWTNPSGINEVQVYITAYTDLPCSGVSYGTPYGTYGDVDSASITGLASDSKYCIEVVAYDGLLGSATYLEATTKV